MESKKRKLFGTDGIRGKANVEPMCVDTILRVGRAAACVFRHRNGGRHSVFLGKDTRLSCYMFESALASGLCSMGVDVLLAGPIPTPGVAFLTSEMRADAGVMISASHNAFEDNGVKFFGPDGFKLQDTVEAEIEALVASSVDLDRERPNSADVGKIVRLDDARGRYITYLKHNFSREHSLKGMKFVLDCAHGATYKIAPTVFTELGARVHVLGKDPNGTNINKHCGALNPKRLAKVVLEQRANMGIAFDGDGDRIMVCDESGHVFDGDDLLAILSKPMQERGVLGSGVVGTVMSNFGLEKYYRENGISFCRASVGDRYVVEKMRETQSMLGGEPSGHLLCLNRSTTGDGILSAILLLEELCRANQPLSFYRDLVPRFPQVLKNVKVRERKPLNELGSVSGCITSAEKELKESGRVLVRYSGTEPKARVMVEGENPDQVQRLADDIVAAIESEIGVG